MTDRAPANWYPDPFGRYDHRYWDGENWTEHVSTHGRQEKNPATVEPPKSTPSRGAKRVRRDVRMAGVRPPSEPGTGTIFGEQVLVVSQKAKLIEVNAEYAVYDQHGQRIGAVREVGRNLVKKAIALRADSERTYRLQVIDANGQVLLALTRPAKFFRSRLVVRTPDGSEVGHIVQKNFGIIAAVRFNLESGGAVVGSMSAEDASAWDFSIQDATGSEIGRITKTWAGLAKEWFTKADNYVVVMTRPLDEPLHSLVIAAALAVDIALRQESDYPGRLNLF